MWQRNFEVVLFLYRVESSFSMSFKCQRDSYLRHFTSAVLSCEPSRLGETGGYEVVLRDTILFPEGGGQVRRRLLWTIAVVWSTAVVFTQIAKYGTIFEATHCRHWPIQYCNAISPTHQLKSGLPAPTDQPDVHTGCEIETIALTETHQLAISTFCRTAVHDVTTPEAILQAHSWESLHLRTGNFSPPHQETT